MLLGAGALVLGAFAFMRIGVETWYLRQLKSENASSRRRAVELLSSMGSRRGIEAIYDRCCRHAFSLKDDAFVIEGLARMGRPAIEYLLTKACDAEEKTDRRQTALQMLARIGRDAVPGLSACLESPVSQLRAYGFFGLLSMAQVLEGRDEVARDIRLRCLALFRDPKSRFREYAMEQYPLQLGSDEIHRSPQVFFPEAICAYVERLEDGETTIRAKALAILRGSTVPAGFLSRLFAILRSLQGNERLEASEFLRSAASGLDPGDGLGWEQLLGALEDGDRFIQGCAAHAIRCLRLRGEPGPWANLQADLDSKIDDLTSCLGYWKQVHRVKRLDDATAFPSLGTALQVLPGGRYRSHDLGWPRQRVGDWDLRYPRLRLPEVAGGEGSRWSIAVHGDFLCIHEEDHDYYYVRVRDDAIEELEQARRSAGEDASGVDRTGAAPTGSAGRGRRRVR